MNGILITVLAVLIGIGVLFNFVGILGLLRFPDVYTRLHAETKTTTFGSIFIAVAVAIYCFVYASTNGDSSWISLGVHALVALIVLAFTNATGSHAIAMSAHARGTKPDPCIVDTLKQDKEKSKEDAS
jgi:multicomponent Na+:H+ antiporter subunit G